MYRRLIVLTLCVLAALVVTSRAQSVIYRDTTPHLTVTYLSDAPKIDGRMDMEVAGLAPHLFGTIERTDSTRSFPEVTYRLAYGADFLYLYIEVPSPSITYRDRGYQNGDGFIVAITSQEKKNQPTRDFYVLGFTPQKDTVSSWQRAFIWYHDVDLAMSPLKETRFAWSQFGDTTGYEVMIPWSELYPYHPWLATPMGFNLCWVSAVGDADKAHELVVADDDIQSEQHPRRYTPLSFTPPHSGTNRAAARMERNNISEGASINALVALVADSGVSQDVFFNVSLPKRASCGSRLVTLVGTGKLDTVRVNVPTLGLVAGDYKINWVSGVDSGAFGLTVFPKFDAEKYEKAIPVLNTSISQASRATLSYLLERIQTGRKEQRLCSTAPILRTAMQDLNYLMTEAISGRDQLAIKTGTFRRAFRSKIDSTLQPYSIHIPVNIDRNKSYPLVVYLHGSGEDDRRALTTPLIPDSMFTLAPFGRGTSNFYSADRAQEDILEAIADVVTNYPIDTTRIIITGFSMGGYGAYRAFFEQPSRYRAAAIFSGHPNLANERGGVETEPNFLDPKFQAPFANRDLFIFHGGRDRNCPIELTRQLVDQLKKTGAKVTIEYEPEAGHEMPSQATIKKFREWLAEVVRH
jgi:predicted esterase